MYPLGTIFLFKISLRAEADSRLQGQLDFGCMKRWEFWRAKQAENFPHNPTCFPHNQHFLPHNVPENFRIICYFFPHPIRCPAFFKHWKCKGLTLTQTNIMLYYRTPFVVPQMNVFVFTYVVHGGHYIFTS